MIKQIAPKSIQKSSMMCTPTRVATKTLPPEVRVHEGITEVRSMLQRVDNAFKKRKEENEDLALTVRELENQLGYLEQQTQEEVAATTSLNLAIDYSRKGIDKMAVEVEKHDKENIDPVSALVDELASALRDACQIMGDCSVEKNKANLAVANINTSTITLAHECETYIQDSQELAQSCEDILAEAETKQAELETIERELTEAAEQKSILFNAITQAESVAIPQIEKQLSELQTALAQKEALAASLKVRVEELHAAEERLIETTSLRRTAFETQLALREEELAGLAARHAELSAHRDARYQALQYLLKQRGEQDSAVAKDSLRLQAKQVQLQESEEELQAVTQSVEELEEQLAVARTDLVAAQQTAQETTQENEEQYELTCMRMTQLREAHQQQSALALSLHQEKVRLAAKIEALTSQAHMEEHARADLEAQVERLHQQMEAAADGVHRSYEALAEAQLLKDEETDTLQAVTTQADRMQANLEQYERDHMRRAELEVSISTAVKKAQGLQLQYEELQADKQAAQAELSSLKAQVAGAKARRKKGLAGTMEELTAEQQHQLDEEVEAELQRVIQELINQHTAEVEEINRCRDKLAQGFPTAVEECEEVQEKEKELDAAREALAYAESEIAQLLELQHEQERIHTATHATAAGAIATTATEAAEGHDEFPLFERQEADVHFDHPEDIFLPSQSLKAAQRSKKQSQSKAVEQKATVPPLSLSRQHTPPPGEPLSRWEMSEPAQHLPVAIFPKPSQASVSHQHEGVHAFIPEGVSASGDFLDDIDKPGSPPQTIRRFGHISVPKSKAVNPHEQSKRQRKTHAEVQLHREKSGVSSETSSFDILKPHPSLAQRTQLSSEAALGAVEGSRNSVTKEAQTRRTPGQFPTLGRAPKPLSTSTVKTKPVHSHHPPVKPQPSTSSTTAPRHQPQQQISGREQQKVQHQKPSLRFPDMKPPGQQKPKQAEAHLHRDPTGAKRKNVPSPSDWFGEDAPF